MTEPTFAELVARVAELEEQLHEVTEERDELLHQVEEQKSRDRRLNYIARGWGP